MKAIVTVALFFCTLRLCAQNNPPEPVLKTVSGGLMQYYISLPLNWNPARRWPIVVVAEAAEKEFKKNAVRFIAARNDMPFIIVAPVIVTNGNYGRRNPSLYPYSDRTWNKIDSITDCKFDMDGVLQIVNEVKKKYNGDNRFFITGFEAGTHLVWAMIFKHPEQLAAAAPVAGNYIGRCVDNDFSNFPGRSSLNVMAFVGRLDTDWGPGGRAYNQFQSARQAAVAHGYKNISETVVPVKGHVPLPGEVLAYFYSLIALAKH